MFGIIRKLRHSLRAFAAAPGGNVAITFAFATLPLILAVGAAVDYSRGNAARADLQVALDSTALMLAKEAATDTTDQLQANALKYFKANFNMADATDISVSASYDSATSSVVVNGSTKVPTDIMHIVGYDNMTIGGSSTATWGSTRLRVALVLDNTGSMSSSGKMTALKSATKSLLSQLQSAASSDGDVYVSIIPFSKDVNVGSANYNANWIDWTDWNSNNQSCSNGGGWGGWSQSSWGWGGWGGWGGGAWAAAAVAPQPTTTPGTAASPTVVHRTPPEIRPGTRSRPRRMERPIQNGRPNNTTFAQSK